MKRSRSSEKPKTQQYPKGSFQLKKNIHMYMTTSCSPEIQNLSQKILKEYNIQYRNFKDQKFGTIFSSAFVNPQLFIDTIKTLKREECEQFLKKPEKLDYMTNFIEMKFFNKIGVSFKNKAEGKKILNQFFERAQMPKDGTKKWTTALKNKYLNSKMRTFLCRLKTFLIEVKFIPIHAYQNHNTIIAQTNSMYDYLCQLELSAKSFIPISGKKDFVLQFVNDMAMVEEELANSKSDITCIDPRLSYIKSIPNSFFENLVTFTKKSEFIYGTASRTHSNLKGKTKLTPKKFEIKNYWNMINSLSQLLGMQENDCKFVKVMNEKDQFGYLLIAKMLIEAMDKLKALSLVADIDIDNSQNKFYSEWVRWMNHPDTIPLDYYEESHEELNKLTTAGRKDFFCRFIENAGRREMFFKPGTFKGKQTRLYNLFEKEFRTVKSRKTPINVILNMTFSESRTLSNEDRQLRFDFFNFWFPLLPGASQKHALERLMALLHRYNCNDLLMLKIRLIATLLRNNYGSDDQTETKVSLEKALVGLSKELN